jgi:beta-mannosidase
MSKDYSTILQLHIYHQIIPTILKDVDPLRPYWPSSPFGYDEDPNDQNSGNTHQWNIWSDWIDYTEVVDDNSLFVSEFGFQAPANKSTWMTVLSKDNRHYDNPMFEFHNKQIEGQKRIFQFLSDHLPVTSEWDDFIYLTQLNQGLALKSCIEHWRANWPRTNGTIIWQLNDCWPAISWSIIDSDLAPKLSYYFVKDVYSDQILTINEENSTININFSNHSKTNRIHGLLKLHIIEQQSGKVIKEYDKQFDIQKCINNIIHKVPIQELRQNGEYILIASVYNDNYELLHRNFYLEQEWKNVNLPEAKLKMEFTEETDLYVLLKTNTPTFFVDLSHPHIKFNTRGFILLPGETKKIKIIQNYHDQFEPDKIRIYSLNKYVS